MKNHWIGALIGAGIVRAGCLAIAMGPTKDIRGVNIVQSQPTSRPAETGLRIAVAFTGGHDTDPRDHGRPVALIAAALNVPPDVFRKVFSGVTPAPGGRRPDPVQVRANKDILLGGLGPYGVTNDRLDNVSNYYRYNPAGGQLWRTTPAAAYATVRDGVVTGVTITNPGSGYSSPPDVSLQGIPKVSLKAAISFSTDLRKNGAIKEITVGRTSGPDNTP
jgi:hypothetical protein